MPIIDGEQIDPFVKALQDVGEWELGRLYAEGGFTKKEIKTIGIKKAKGLLEKIKALPET